MIESFDPDLEWNIRPALDGQVEVSVRHKDHAGWAITATEEEGKRKALARLNYAADLDMMAYGEEKSD